MESYAPQNERTACSRLFSFCGACPSATGCCSNPHRLRRSPLSGGMRPPLRSGRCLQGIASLLPSGTRLKALSALRASKCIKIQEVK